MEGSAAVSDAPLVSPPPMDLEEPRPPPARISELFAAPNPASLQSTPSGSPARRTEASVAQHGQQTQKPPATPETASSGSSQRSGSDAEPALADGEKASANGQLAAQNGAAGEQAAGQTADSPNGEQSQMQNAGSKQIESAEPKPVKTWFEVISMVLQNFRTHEREQIKQLTMPRCTICGLSKRDRKAELTCHQEGCRYVNTPLCSTCWDTTHSSDETKTHRHLPSSICQQCHLERIAYWCAECDLKFCRECYAQIHSVEKTKSHRKLATEDAPGSCLAQSDWSGSFQSAIMQLVAARKHPPPSSEADSINGKRKRDVDVIVIDDDDDINGDNVEISPPGTNEAFDSRTCNSAATLNQKKKQNGGVSVAAVNALSRVGGTATQPQGNPYTNAGAAFVPSPAAHNSMIEPIPFPATSSVQPNVTFTSPSMPNGAYQANINTSSGTQWNNGVDNFHGSATSMATPNISAGVDASVMRSGMLQMSPTSMANAMSTPMNTTSGVWSTTSAMNTTSGVWSTTSAISTDMASASYPSNLLPLGGAVFAENALVDSLVDRYHEMNQTVTNMELQCNQLTQQIAVATCQGPYVAAPVMGALNNLQPMLQNAKARRDKFLIAMIIQSHDIMAAVRLLRLTELGDVPQVPMISHRKCLQISNEINLHKKKLIELNQRLSKTLNQSHAVGLRWENNLIRRTSASIQMHERSIKKLKKDREVEIVRIVQFSKNIRDALKRAFQRSVEIQRQQQQQQQQQQQFPPYG